MFVTIELPDAKDVTQSLDPEGKLVFSAKAGPENKAYEANLELFDKIDVEVSRRDGIFRQTLSNPCSFRPVAAHECTWKNGVGRYLLLVMGGCCRFVTQTQLNMLKRCALRCMQASKAVTTLRHTSFMIVKAESKWWPRLLKASGRAPAFLKVDWDKWVDEDEEEENAGKSESIAHA